MVSIPSVFLSYSREDEAWKERLKVHLKPLERLGALVIWDDRRINAGATWYDEIQQAIDAAKVAVCLISPDYLASDFCTKEEVPYLLRRRADHGVHLLPILLRPCLWEVHPWLRGIQMLPRDGKFVLRDFRDNEDEVFRTVAKAVLDVLEVETTVAPGPSLSVPETVDLSRGREALPPPRLEVTLLPVTGAELFGRQDEMNWLHQLWDERRVRIASLSAWGGVGKSTLVNKWLETLAAEGYRGARRIYGWSFYSPGVGSRVTSSDQFVNHALEWFGDPDPTKGLPWTRGERLAKLIERERTLLILDGLQPVQSTYGGERGRIRDPALSTLLSCLAISSSESLCLITTREPLPELDRFPETVVRKNLEQISTGAGRALLRVGGARGTDAELEEISEAFGNHALAIQLLAAYLRDSTLRAALEIPDLAVPDAEGRHPRRVLEAFARRFGKSAELDLLKILGLFDRPASQEALAAVREAPVIPGLTEHLLKLSEADWLRLVQRCRDLRLISRPDQDSPDTLEAHPLLREHFGERLSKEAPGAWREGHRRLFEHYRSSARELPETLAEMTPLYVAVVHGCKAGRHQEAFSEVYWPRILRGEEFFSRKKLGAVGANLAALSAFFAEPWTQPVATLDESTQAFLLNSVGFHLRAFGRLEEAAAPTRLALAARIEQKDWRNASSSASNLSSLHLTRGALPLALIYAHWGVELAERSQHMSERIKRLAILAETLHQIGQWDEARSSFHRAEELQKSWDPERPLLCSVSGFLYHDLLLDLGEWREVKRRASQVLQWEEKEGVRRDIAMEHLVLGLALLRQQEEDGTGELEVSEEHLERAVEGLRERSDLLPRALLGRARFHLACKRPDLARSVLEEALTLSRHCGLCLQEVDCLLALAHLHLTLNEKAEARENLSRAHTLIEETGYHRRNRDLSRLAASVAD